MISRLVEHAESSVAPLVLTAAVLGALVQLQRSEIYGLAIQSRELHSEFAAPLGKWYKLHFPDE
jgi:hypothetical protein